MSNCVLGRNFSPNPNTIFSDGDKLISPRLKMEELGNFKVAKIILETLVLLKSTLKSTGAQGLST